MTTRSVLFVLCSLFSILSCKQPPTQTTNAATGTTSSHKLWYTKTLQIASYYPVNFYGGSQQLQTKSTNIEADPFFARTVDLRDSTIAVFRNYYGDYRQNDSSVFDYALVSHVMADTGADTLVTDTVCFFIEEITDSSLVCTYWNRAFFVPLVNGFPVVKEKVVLYLSTAPTTNYNVLSKYAAATDTGCVTVIPMANYYSGALINFPDTCKMFQTARRDSLFHGSWTYGKNPAGHENNVSFIRDSVYMYLDGHPIKGLWNLVGDTLCIKARSRLDYYNFNIIKLKFAVVTNDSISIDLNEKLWITVSDFDGKAYLTYRTGPGIVVCDWGSGNFDCLNFLRRR